MIDVGVAYSRNWDCHELISCLTQKFKHVLKAQLIYAIPAERGVLQHIFKSVLVDAVPRQGGVASVLSFYEFLRVGGNHHWRNTAIARLL